MSTPAEIVEQVFDETWTLANTKTTSSDTLFTKALNAVSTPSMDATDMSFDTDVVEPDVTIPKNAESASLAMFYELQNSVIAKLAALFKGYIDDYFPDESGYFESIQTWIADAVQNGGTGIKASVEAQIWARDRSRILKEAQRAEEEVLTSFASRRYPMPPGAAAHQIMMVRAQASDQIAAASRDVAIKQADMEIENVRFAVQQGIELYKSAMAAAGDYIKALSISSQVGMQLIPSITDSQSKLISAASEYYRARIAVSELRLKATQTNAEFDQQARKENVELTMDSIKQRVAAAISAAQAMATQAAAALNSLHAAASISAGASNSVNYSYSNLTDGSPDPVTSV